MKIIAVLFDLYGTLAGFEPSRFSLQSKVAKKYGYELTEKGVAQGYFLADKFMAEQNVTYPIRSQSELEKKNFFSKYEKLVLSGDGHDVDVETSGKIFKELQKIPYSMQLYSDAIPVSGDLKEKYADNRELSSVRASRVVSYLEEQGIKKSRLKAIGYGENWPYGIQWYQYKTNKIDGVEITSAIIAKYNNTPEKRKTNRRIKIVFTNN